MISSSEILQITFDAREQRCAWRTSCYSKAPCGSLFEYPELPWQRGHFSRHTQQLSEELLTVLKQETPWNTNTLYLSALIWRLIGVKIRTFKFCAVPISSYTLHVKTQHEWRNRTIEWQILCFEWRIVCDIYRYSPCWMANSSYQHWPKIRWLILTREHRVYIEWWNRTRTQIEWRNCTQIEWRILSARRSSH